MRTTLVRLSGGSRGRTEAFTESVIRIGTAPDCTLRFDPPDDAGVAPHHAEIRFEDCGFLLTDLGCATGTFLNGVQVTEVLLEDGDLIEVGRGGPKLRFRARPEELAGCVPFRILLSDACALARGGTAGRVAGASLFATSLLRGVLRETSWRLKGVALGLTLVLATWLVGLPAGLYRAHRATERVVTGLATRLEEEQVQREDLERRVAEGRRLIEGSWGELDDLVATLRREDGRRGPKLDRIERSVQALEAEGSAGERILRTYAGGVALLQGTVVFEDAVGRRLRYLAADERGRPLRDPLGRAPVSVDGAGPPVKQTVLGTAFLVSPQGVMLTNRHVVDPAERAPQPIAGVAVRPRLTDLRAFFPGLADPVAVEVLRTSAEADAAVLKADLRGRSLPILPLDGTGREAVAGRPVLLMGYPGGVELLLARVEPSLLRSLVPEGAVELSTVVERLARRNLIRPYVTWGHLADVRPHELAYDAPTTGGGSGGPVLSLRGRVIGINYGVARNFDGASFGVPIQIGVALVP